MHTITHIHLMCESKNIWARTELESSHFQPPLALLLEKLRPREKAWIAQMVLLSPSFLHLVKDVLGWEMLSRDPRLREGRKQKLIRSPAPKEDEPNLLIREGKNNNQEALYITPPIPAQPWEEHRLSAKTVGSLGRRVRVHETWLCHSFTGWPRVR